MAKNTTQCPQPGLEQGPLDTDIGHTDHETTQRASTCQVCIKQLLARHPKMTQTLDSPILFPSSSVTGIPLISSLFSVNNKS